MPRRVFGHEWAQRLLQQSVLAGRTAHAYLFAGPDQVGKTTLARAFAQALTCTQPQPGAGLGACRACRACRLAEEGGHPDHRLIESAGGQLKIEQVRDLIHEANISPIEGRYKVFILPAFDRANANAANALLKTLEEPTATTRILLTSSLAAGLLPTITSRCQVVQLRLLPEPVIAEALASHWQAPPEQAALLAGLCGGRLGWAVEILTHPDAWKLHLQQIEDMLALAQQNSVERMGYAATLAGGADVETALRRWLWWWRDVMLMQQGCENLIVHRDRWADIQRLAGAASPGEVRRFLAALMTTASYLRTNANVLLALEALLLKTPQVA